MFSIGHGPYNPSDAVSRHAGDELMRRLAKRLEREPPPAGPLNAIDNPTIPSGYTYFLQLVAHDIVHSSASLSLSGGRLALVNNTRSAPLRLETIFGNGPAANPKLFEPSSHGSKFHPVLRVGPLRENGLLGAGQTTPIPSKLEFDIDRATCPFGHNRSARSLAEPIIGDPRNDDQPLLGQQVVLWHHVYNAILKAINPALGTSPFDGNFYTDYMIYLCARSAATLIYRRLIRNDLLKRLLHPMVREIYENNIGAIRDVPIVPGRRWQAPFELTHGAFRAAHMMVRSSYIINDVGSPEEFSLTGIMQQSSAASPDQMPLQIKWAVDWKRFFGTNAINLSRRILPHYDDHLFDLAIFPSEDSTGIPGLAYRDLLSNIDGQPWSLAALVDVLRPTHGSLLDASPLLRQDATNPTLRSWQAPLVKWLSDVPAYQPADDFSASDIATLAADPPLAMFFIYEAGNDPATDGGQRLGTLASIVVADAFYNILRRDPVIADDFNLSLQASLSQLSNVIFGDGKNHLDFVPEIETFDDLLAFMSTRMPQVF